MKLITSLALTSCVVVGALLSGCSSSETTTTTENTATTSTTGTTSGASTSGASTSGASTSGATQAAAPVKTVPKGSPLKLAFITNNASDFWTIAEKGTEKAHQEMPQVTVDFRMNAQGQAADQKQIIDDLLAKGEDGLAISPKDPANQTDMINAAAAKTLVFTQDSDAPQTNRACYVGTDNHAAGLQAGGEIKKALPNGGKIMLFVGSLDAQNAKDRRQGIMDAIKGSKVEIIDTLTDETDKAKAVSNVSDTLVKNPDVAALVGLWSYNGPAIYKAVKDQNKAGKVKIICFDEEDDTLTGVADGTITATIVQQPFEFGHKAIILMAKYLYGDKSVIPPSKQIYVPTRVINKANVATFRTELNKLRGRS